MKVQVVNNLSEFYSAVIDVRMLNYDYIFGHLENSSIAVKVAFEDVDFIYENEFEEKIVKYRDLLKISLPGTVTIRFYGAFCSVLEEYFNEEIKSITILKDDDEKARKGYWYKRVELIINEIRPACITASGRNYADKYNVNMEDIDILQFIYNCKKGIYEIKTEIGKNLERLRIYEKALRSLNDPNDDPKKKALEGM
ncbi:hypothetical protein OXPF_16130 [Oxobacter pfennigii]|uniref:Uncharacterized protein n=1 Tax=Oxobacter pfennigii TaxID=36849 RepID=A0A0P8X155_9CLOT|nr:hypothetical protein [Oxobacter pfennigii]KPU44530.1 hypothetical protein OXPF_16130 [Oxobacter pfennigii]